MIKNATKEPNMNQPVNFPVRSIPMTISSAAAAALLNVASDWDLVVRFLGYGSDYSRLMTGAEKDVVRYLADGFGTLTAEDAVETAEHQDLLRDWSHVRDSSPAAVARMAAAIRSFFAAHTVDY